LEIVKGSAGRNMPNPIAIFHASTPPGSNEQSYRVSSLNYTEQ
jgi:hypothetical protein